MTSALLVFLATFTTVFFLGLQSRNVNQGLYIAAAVTSFFIATGSLHLYEVLSRPTGLDRVGYYVGGIVGITFSIWFHQRFKDWWLWLWQSIKFRFGPTPTWRWQYWVPHIVFPHYPNRLIDGCLGFWAFGRKIEVSWDFRRKA